MKLSLATATLALALCLAQTGLAAPVPSSDETVDAALQARGGGSCFSCFSKGSSSRNRPAARPVDDDPPVDVTVHSMEPTHGYMSIHTTPRPQPRPAGYRPPPPPANVRPPPPAQQQQESMYMSGPQNSGYYSGGYGGYGGYRPGK